MNVKIQNKIIQHRINEHFAQHAMIKKIYLKFRKRQEKYNEIITIYDNNIKGGANRSGP